LHADTVATWPIEATRPPDVVDHLINLLCQEASAGSETAVAFRAASKALADLDARLGTPASRVWAAIDPEPMVSPEPATPMPTAVVQSAPAQHHDGHHDPDGLDPYLAQLQPVVFETRTRGLLRELADAETLVFVT
jgi:hypothetical protein